MKHRRALLFSAVLVLCVGCDQAVKDVARSALAGGERVSLLGDVLQLELAQNPGAFLSLGARLPEAVRSVAFLVFVPLVIATVCVFAAKAGPLSCTAVAALGLLAGGGLGNWLDRLLREGTVTDYVSLGAGPLRTGIFNLADVFILAGAGLLLLAQSRPHTERAPPPGER